MLPQWLNPCEWISEARGNTWLLVSTIASLFEFLLPDTVMALRSTTIGVRPFTASLREMLNWNNGLVLNNGAGTQFLEFSFIHIPASKFVSYISFIILQHFLFLIIPYLLVAITLVVISNPSSSFILSLLLCWQRNPQLAPSTPHRLSFQSRRPQPEATPQPHPLPSSLL